MNTQRLYEILKETTREFRKGQMIEGTSPLAEAMRAEVGKPASEQKWPSAGGVVEVYMMPHVSEASDRYQLIDCEFLEIGVDREKALPLKEEIILILKTYDGPNPLSQGPSYIEVGGVLGDQSAAFSLFALGKVIGLWDIITPATFGFEGREARQAAERGFIMIAPGREI